MQPIPWGSAADGTRDIKEVSVAVGSGSQYGIHECHCIGFTPGDLGSFGRSCAGLIRRTSPGWLASKIGMGAHEPPGHFSSIVVNSGLFGSDEVQRTHIGGGRNADFGISLNQLFTK